MSKIETKRLKFDENANLEEKFIKNIGTGKNSGTFLRGHAIFRDPITGEVLQEKDNLIVLRGRTFVLEKLFNKKITSVENPDYIANLNRKVCLFKIGDGGANVQTAPFNPFVPEHDDVDLAHAVPFITVDPDKNLDPVKQKNPSIVTELSSEDKLMYHGPVVDGKVTHYMYKTFDGYVPGSSTECGTSFLYDLINNEIAVKCSLRISVKDSRTNAYINELALVFAEYIPETKSYKDMECLSRLTFDTESLTNESKQILIDYYIYA